MSFKINFKSVVMYAFYALLLLLVNCAADTVPLSAGLYFAMLLCGTNIIATPVIYILASAIRLNLLMSLTCLFEAVFLAAVTLIYRKTGRKIRIEAAAYIAIALAPYIAFGPCPSIDGLFFTDNAYAVKGIAAAAVIIFSFFCFKTVYAAIYRLYRCRLKEDELLCCAVVYAAAGVGLYSLTGEFFYTAFAAGAIVAAVRLMRSPAALVFALIAALPPAVVTLTLKPLTVFTVAATATLLFARAGRMAPSIIMLAMSAVYSYFSGFFDCTVALLVFRAIALFCLTVLPSIPSQKTFNNIRNALLVREVLPDTAVERSRRRTGERLFRISEVFREIECAFSALDEEVNDESARERMLNELKDKCCKNCEKRKRCEKSNTYSGFKKLIDAGCIKGKVNLIDLPSEITINCSEPTDVLARLNALLAEYRRYMTETENAKSGRKLLADQARGVAEVMKNCAVDLSRTYSQFREQEEAIRTKLSSAGISCPELYVNGENSEISAVVNGNVNLKALLKIVSEETGRRYLLKDKLSYDERKCCLILSSPPKYDAAFGVAYRIKGGETASGDTHSVIRINEHSFLMALSDGMGSGEYAQKISATAISLIEAFYRAEMPEGTVLNTINKLLSFNRDERFTCIDIAAVNLDTGVADFVKIGSPAGFIVREDEIRMLESQSLPLGILDNLKPAVCSESLKNGDIVVFMSDGITSAFPSQTEMYEFMEGLKPLNPQNLADKILDNALSRNGGRVVDDMTVVCTRIFEPTPA